MCISSLDNKVVCLVQTMYIYLQDRPKLHGQLFCHFNGTPLTSLYGLPFHNRRHPSYVFLYLYGHIKIYIYIILSVVCHFTSVGAIICFYCGQLKISKVIIIVTFLIKLWPNTANLYNCVYYFWSSQIIQCKFYNR